MFKALFNILTGWWAHHIHDICHVDDRCFECNETTCVGCSVPNDHS